MTRLYAWLWQGCASLALAVLLVGLAAWGTHNAFAEDLVPVTTDCNCSPSDETCLTFCMSVCDVTCSGSFPLCGTGSCAAPMSGCEKYKCKLILAVPACECNAWKD